MAGHAHAHEQAFYDAHADQLDPDRMPPRPPDSFERSVLDAAGPLEGLRVLEAGCGTGDLTLELLRRGAAVTALDISAGMVAVARTRAERFRGGADARFVTAPLERTGLRPESVDRVVGKWVLHHADLRRAADEIARVLIPRGRAVFFENQALNPLLSFARRHLLGCPAVGRVGTPDERPLDAEDFAYLRRAFSTVTVDHPNFYFFELFGRQVLRHRGLLSLRTVDAFVWRRAPALRRYSYHVLLTLTKS